MRLPSHLRRSIHGVFYFRLTIPRNLRAALGRREIGFSLSTRDPVEAKRLAYGLSAGYIEHIRNTGEGAEMGRRPDDYEGPDVSDIIAQVDRNLGGGMPQRAIVDYKPDGSIQRLQTEAHDTPEQIQSILRNAAPKSSQFDPGNLRHIPWVRRPMSLSAAIKQYTDSKPKDLQDPTTKTERFRRLEDFRLWALMPVKDGGPDLRDPHVHSIGSAECRAFKTFLMSKDPGRRGLAEATASKAMSFLTHFFQYLVTTEAYPRGQELPTKGLYENTQENKDAASDMFGFEALSDSDLRKVFNTEQCLAMTTPHQFWAPLIAFYAGLRVNEAAQLRIEDIEKDKEGMSGWSISVNTKAGNKLKRGCVRRVPIHNDLVKVGLLDYIKDVRQVLVEFEKKYPAPMGNGKVRFGTEQDRLFHYLHDDKNNGRGRRVSRDFSERMEAFGFDDRKRFHSFRRTLNGFMTGAGIGEMEAGRFLGHIFHTTTNTSYRKGQHPLDLFRKMKFPVVKPEALRYKPGRFKDELRAELEIFVRHYASKERRERVRKQKEEPDG